MTRSVLTLAPAVLWVSMFMDGGHFLEFLVLATVPASIDAWVRLRVARIEAMAKIVTANNTNGESENE